MPPSSLSALLDLFGGIWESGGFPPSWREAVVVPVPGAGKGHANPVGCGPIALTGCVCGTMERVVDGGLVWCLGSNGLVAGFRGGFGRRRGAVGRLVRFESFIRDAFVGRGHLVSVFFGLGKACDAAWRYGIMNDLSEIGLKGRLPGFVSGFLDGRQFGVCVGSALSDARRRGMGVPRGGVQSVTLFSVIVGGVVEGVGPVGVSLYVRPSVRPSVRALP